MHTDLRRFCSGPNTHYSLFPLTNLNGERGSIAINLTETSTQAKVVYILEGKDHI